MTAEIPDVMPGHWITKDGADMARRFGAMQRHELKAQNMTDMEVANAVFLDANLMNLTVAKDRIRWLSVHLAMANVKVAGLTQVDDAVGGLRKYCNAMIKQMTQVGADNFPCFHALNAFLRECDKVFMAQNFENSSAAVVHDPRVIDNDRDEITISLGGKELRGWSYANDAERRVKMLCAHEYVEGWHNAIAKKGETS